MSHVRSSQICSAEASKNEGSTPTEWLFSVVSGGRISDLFAESRLLRLAPATGSVMTFSGLELTTFALRSAATAASALQIQLSAMRFARPERIASMYALKPGDTGRAVFVQVAVIDERADGHACEQLRDATDMIVVIVCHDRIIDLAQAGMSLAGRHDALRIASESCPGQPVSIRSDSCWGRDEQAWPGRPPHR